MATELPSLEDVAAALKALGIGIGASEFHGLLSGWLAGNGALPDDWLRRVMVDDDLPAPPPPDGALARLAAATRERFEERDFDLALLLAADDAPLVERSGSLFDWCRGFLGGFGLGAGATPPLSDEGREALADLGKLAAARAQEDGDEDDESALAEIEEFVRIAALLLHGDCVLGPRHRQRLN